MVALLLEPPRQGKRSRLLLFPNFIRIHDFSWRYKLAGRVGDSPVIGSGLYCDGDVAAAVATGDGEEVNQFLPSHRAPPLIQVLD